MQYPIRRKLRPKDARRSNRSFVLQAVNDNPPLSRADLARETGLTKVTISDLVAELIDSGLVIETGTSEMGRPGKPSTLLALNPAGRDILAIDLSARDQVRGAVLSLRGEPVLTKVRALDGATGQQALDAARALAAELVEAASHPILGLGVGTPGTVDPSGTVLWAPNLHWTGLPLQARLQDDLGLPVKVENDANVAALAERRFAGAPGNLVRIQFSRGVGAGLLVGGRLVHGAASDAGEIGHVTIGENGPLCGCGKTGCLEAWASVPVLRTQMDADPGRADDILARAGRRLGLALAPVVGMLGLQHIVVGGPADVVTPALLDAARSCIVERTRSQFRPQLELVASSLGEDAVLLGAGALVTLTELGVT
ncbi:ROK family transcriptional regulator [Micropruina sp.]|uniref:ROK family transcriptional regulator n=1 Tax=Micropruina sp. TaxID=2737536 RepID=UPI002602E345|nr:ROK family transcriptional regulator [Micropruina sp.]